MIFTVEQINEIKRRLAEEGVKDSDLPSADKIEGDELCAIVQGGVNKTIPLWKLFNSPAFETYYQLLQDTITDRMNQLERLIEQVKRENLSVSDEFGDSDTITVSQKALTDAFNRLWDKFEEWTGETYQGINMTISPKYFIGENGAQITVQAATAEINGKFENIRFTLNGDTIYEAENVEDVTFVYPIELVDGVDKYILTCYAKILGKDYTAQGVITHYNSFWLGAGNSWQDVMIDANVRDLNKSLRGAFDVSVGDNEHIIVVMDAAFRSSFYRLDINGVEIPMTRSEITVDDATYDVYTSDDSYAEGVYNVDVNG